MSLKMIKALAVAACLLGAGTAHAQVYNTVTGTLVTGAVTTTINTSTSGITGPIVISGTGSYIDGSLASPTGPAITFNSHFAASNTLMIDTGAAISNTGIWALEVSDPSAGIVTINNSGSLVTSGDKVISATLATNAINLTNNGTISGSIYTGSGGSTIKLVSGTMSGNIVYGAGTNTLTISGTTLNGNITGGINADVINIHSGGLISGTITDNTSNDGDTINFHADAGTYTISNSISGIENINVSNSLNINAGITGVQFFTINPSGTLTINSNLGLVNTGTMNVSGTLNIAAGHTLTANTIHFAPTSLFNVNISDSTHAGLLITSNTIATAPKLNFDIASNAGYIANGTYFTLISSTGAVATPTTLLNSSPLYTYNLLSANHGLGLAVSISRTALSALVQGSTNKSIAAALDATGANSKGDLLTVQNDFNGATSAGQINSIIESLQPATQTGAAIASVNVGTATTENVDTRLASLRSPGDTSLALNGNSLGGQNSGVNTGDSTYSHNFWGQGFANHTDQDNKNGNAGFTANTAGANIGADTDELIDGITTGGAATYAYSSVDGKGSGNDNTNLDTYLLTLYASKIMNHGMFINGQIGGGYNSYTASRQAIGFADQTTAKYNGEQGTAKLDGGIDLPIDQVLSGLVLTPLASAQYTYLRTGAYTEKGPTAQSVESATFNAIDLGAGAQLAINYALPQGLTLQPSLRARYVYRAGDDTVDTTSRFIAGGPAFNATGIALDRSSIDLGGGLLLAALGGSNLSLTYDADLRSSLIGHTGQLKFHIPF